jgi:hypothetical protein
MCRRPSPDHAFFEQPVLQHLLGKRFLQAVCLGPQGLYLVARRRTGCIAGQALPACFEELLRPAVIQALRNPLATAQLGDAVLAAQARQHDADLLFC